VTEAPTTVGEVILAGAAAWPDRVAIQGPMRAWTYRALAEEVAEIAADLLASGVAPGDRVAAAVRASAESLVALLGVASIATVAPVDPALPPAVLATVLARVEPAVVVTSIGLDETLGSPAGTGVIHLDERGLRVVPDAGRTVSAVPGVVLRGAAPEMPAVIVPAARNVVAERMVVMPHRQVTAGAVALADGLGLAASDGLLLTAGPLQSDYLPAVLATLLRGGRVVVPPERDAASISVAASGPGVTWVAGSAALLHHAAYRLGRWERPEPLRMVVVFGSIARATAREAIRIGFGAPIAQVLGSAEALTIAMTTAWSTDDEFVPLCTSLRVADHSGNHLALGNEGEIQTFGDHVCAGYLGDAIGTAGLAVGDGWVRTGDLGVMTAEGTIRVTGTASPVIVSGGARIDPRLVEEAALAHPAVSEAVAAGVAHPMLGQTVHLTVVLVAGTAESPALKRELRRHLIERLPTPAVPREIVFSDALPEVDPAFADEVVPVRGAPIALMPAMEGLWSSTVLGPVELLRRPFGLKVNNGAEAFVKFHLRPTAAVTEVTIAFEVPHEALIGETVVVQIGALRLERHFEAVGRGRWVIPVSLPADVPFLLSLTVEGWTTRADAPWVTREGKRRPPLYGLRRLGFASGA